MILSGGLDSSIVAQLGKDILGLKAAYVHPAAMLPCACPPWATCRYAVPRPTCPKFPPCFHQPQHVHLVTLHHWVLQVHCPGHARLQRPAVRRPGGGCRGAAAPCH